MLLFEYDLEIGGDLVKKLSDFLFLVANSLVLLWVVVFLVQDELFLVFQKHLQVLEKFFVLGTALLLLIVSQAFLHTAHVVWAIII